MNKFWQQYPELNEELIYVNSVITKNLKSRNKYIQSSLSELLAGGGKFLRPAFVLLSHGFGKEKSNDVYTLAAVIEMLHMATLVHDDVIDDADLRRGKKTIQHAYGKNFAVYVGDYLFCICFNLLSKTKSASNIQIDSMAMARICIGEIDQFTSRFNKDTTIKEYLRRISYKTAELFSLGFYAGALEGKCDKKLISTLANIGHNIGMAFQIIDDLLDFFGDESTVGKPVCSDLKQGIFTLPVILSMKNNNKDLNTILSKEDFSDSDIKEIMKFLEEDKSFERTRKVAKKYTDKAFKLINSLPDIENRKILLDVTENLLIRNY